MKIQIITILIILMSIPVFGIENSEVLLKDGSRIYGKIISIDNGTYKIKSDALGTIVINENKIQSFNYKSGGGSASSTDMPVSSDSFINSKEIQGIQKEMLANDDILDLLLSLQSDKRIQSIIADEGLQKAINTGNINELLNNPKFMELLNHKTVKDIKSKMQN